MFEDIAKSAAQKVCGQGQCLFVDSFNCGHTNKSPFFPPRKLGVSTECPLAKYNVTPNEKANPFDGSWDYVDTSELLCICANCEHATAELDDNCLSVNRTEDTFKKFCIDCPVQAVRENVQEAAAEAACS